MPLSTSVTAQEFEGHLTFLKDNGYTVVALADALEAVQGGTSLPDKAIVITFDDAWRNIYQQGFPLLKKYLWVDSARREGISARFGNLFRL